MLERMMVSRIEIHFSCALASLSMTIGRTPSSHSLRGKERERGEIEGGKEKKGRGR